MDAYLKCDGESDMSVHLAFISIGLARVLVEIDQVAFVIEETMPDLADFSFASTARFVNAQPFSC